MTLLDRESPRPGPAQPTGGDENEETSLSVSRLVDVSVRHHVGTSAMLTLVSVLTTAIGINTWWGLTGTRASLEVQIEEGGRQAAEAGSRELTGLQVASAGNVVRTADAVLDGPVEGHAMAVAMAIEAAEEAGRTRSEIESLIEFLSRAAGIAGIEAETERGRTYSLGDRERAGITDGVRERLESERGTSLPARTTANGLRKVGGARSATGQTRAEVTIDLALEEASRQYGTAADGGARTISDEAASGIARTMARAIDLAVEAEWSSERIEEWLEDAVDATALRHVMTTDVGGRSIHEGGRRSFGSNLAQRREMEVRESLAAAGSGRGALLGQLTEQRLWIATGMATGDYSESATRISVETAASSRGLLETAWQLETDELAAMESIERSWIAVMGDGDTRIIAAAPRFRDEAEAESVWLAWSEEHEAEALRAESEGRTTATSAASVLRVEDARVVAAAPIGRHGNGTAVLVIEQEARGAIQQMRDEAIVGLSTAGGLILFLGGATAIGARRWLTKPIEAISDAARCLTAGERPPAELTEGLGRRGDEIGSLARNFDEMTVEVLGRQEELQRRVDARTQELRSSNESLRETDERRRKELEVAKSVQRGLISTGDREYEATRVTARMTPARELGGDFTTMVERSDGSVCLAICDVSGKGVGAALFMAAAQSALTAAAGRGATVREIADETNRALQEGNELRMFVTAVIAVLTPATGQLEYVCAGHEPPLCMLADGRAPTRLAASGGIPLGVPNTKDRYNKRMHKLAPGETIIAYTDGITDACNERKEDYGEERLQALVGATGKKTPAELVDTLWGAIDEFIGDAPATDDKTCLVIQRERRQRRSPETKTTAKKGRAAAAKAAETK